MRRDFAVLEKQLLEDYQAGDFFFASPGGTLLGKGCFAVVQQERGKGKREKGLVQQVDAVLRQAKVQGFNNPVVTGAVPFDARQKARLIVPATLAVSDRLPLDVKAAFKPPVTSAYAVKSIPEPQAYSAGVAKGIDYIKSGRLSKIVLSRALQLTSSAAVDIHQLLCNLAQHNLKGYTFAVNLADMVPDQPGTDSALERNTLIGASPELLIARSGLQVTANPLAGSRPRGDTAAEDRRLAGELLSSRKDLHEHEVVVQAVAAALKPYCRKLTVPEAPSLINTEAVWHLSTKITAEIADPAVSSLELAMALHPTPAVCGSPTEAARAAIERIEPFDRGFFTGIVGWCDATGNGEWAVAIRCAEIQAQSLCLFAGAGVVAGSKPEEELAETAAKFRTMLTAMGIDKEVAGV
ncbi:Isochorismate synthase DhbC [Propionispora sp. 2/2-37]|uniref:isochorismate synthase DhbC n=1 Tax=Propionispora sp. 2/2-37 TaxID=1677858 RepID=UPI0006BB985F|nr:isochorismate synthase DhbC [Propionispora sp. 2/2-37]CUH95312.1 Isochorismate synthase DhbC [Propionispora sp. 2/2-37]